MQYVLTVVVSDPNLFIIPATISFAAVLFAAIIYSCFVFKEHGHLFHKDKLTCKSKKEDVEIEQSNQIEEGNSIPLEPIANTSSEPAAEETNQNLEQTSQPTPAEDEIMVEEITASIEQIDYSR